MENEKITAGETIEKAPAKQPAKRRRRPKNTAAKDAKAKPAEPKEGGKPAADPEDQAEQLAEKQAKKRGGGKKAKPAGEAKPAAKKEIAPEKKKEEQAGPAEPVQEHAPPAGTPSPEPRQEPELPELPEEPERPEPPETAAPAAESAAAEPEPAEPEIAEPENPEPTIPEPEIAEPEEDTAAPEQEKKAQLTPEQRAAEERRLADITRTVQVSIEKIVEAAEEKEEPEPPAERAGAKAARAVRMLLGWLLLVVVLVGLIAAAGIYWLYRKATPDMIPAVTVTVEGQSLEPMAYSWQVPVAGNYLKRTYADTVSTAPTALEADFGGGIMKLKVSPSDCTTAITVTDSSGEEVYSGTSQEFGSYRFTENGDYTAKLVVSSGEGYQTEPTVTGSQTYEFTFTVSISAAVRLNTQSVTQGGVAALRVTGQQDASEEPTLSTTLPATGFYKSGSGWVAYLPIAYDTEPGGYEIRVTTGGNTQTVTLTVQERTESYRDYNSKSGLVTPYVGADDTPQEVLELLDTAGDTLCWADTGFASPFSDSVEITLPYGLTEYVGRTQAERRSNTGTGRTSINTVLSGRCSLVAPAGGKVLLAEKLDDVGNTIVIEHGAGVKTIFYGLRSLEVEAGDTVAQGDLLGKTNSATVAEVRIGTVPVEPLSILRGQCDALRAD